MKNKHLTAAERITLQAVLDQGETRAEAARKLGKAKSTISREIKLHSVEKGAHTTLVEGTPLPIYDCAKIGTCGSGKTICKTICSARTPAPCQRRDRNGFCNGCPQLKKPRGCKLAKKMYDASIAQAKSDYLRRSCRTGVNVSEEQLALIGKIISNGVKNGQSLQAICMSNPDIPVSPRTLYEWIENKVFEEERISNIDLPSKVKRKYRLKKGLKTKVRKENVITRERTHDAFEAYMKAHPYASVVEMDTVYNDVTNGPFMQTFLSRAPHHLFLALYQKEKTSKAMYEGVKRIYELLGPEEFKRHFEVILTDRGAEFMAAREIEKDFGVRVFYCDPMQSIQKALVENKHKLLRRIFPKKRDLRALGLTSQENLNVAVSHINSYPVASLQGKTPYDYFCFLENGCELLDKLGIKKIGPASVYLKPDLLTR